MIDAELIRSALSSDRRSQHDAAIAHIARIRASGESEMKKKATALVLLALFLHTSGAGSPLFASTAQDQSPNVTRVEIAKAHAKKHTVEVTLPTGKKLKGKVTEYTDEAFVLRDKSGTDTSLAYTQVRVTRHRPLGTKILIGVGIGAASAGGLLLCGATNACY